MLENVLVRHNCSLKIKVTVKGLVSLGCIVLAVLLPQLVHLALGQAGGVQWLPMYLPVLLGSCLLGSVWGLGIGVLSPLVSFAITSAWGDPMPALARLPFMMAELAVFAAVSGLFTKKIAENGWMAFPAVLLAQRGVRCSCCSSLSFSRSRPSRPRSSGRRSRRGLLVWCCRRCLFPSS